MTRYVERLCANHNRSDFGCGRPELDDWFHRVAGQAEQKHGLARVFVLVDDEVDGGRTPIGFYALIGHAVAFEEAPPEITKGQSPHHPIGAVLLGQLAVDLRFSKQGLGEMLLADVVRQALAADERVALPLLVVDALDDRGVRWYEGYGFRLFHSNPRRLAIRLADARVTFGLPPRP